MSSSRKRKRNEDDDSWWQQCIAVKYNSRNKKRVYDNTIKMLEARRYTEIHESDLVLAASSTAQIECKNNSETVTVQFVYNYSRDLAVEIDSNVKAALKPLNRIILVCQRTTRASFKEFSAWQSRLRGTRQVELFGASSFEFHLPNVYIVRQYEPKPISTAAQAELLKRSQRQHLPIMSSSDPIARFYGAVRGDIFHIVRRDPAVGHYPYYRIVL